MEEKDILFFLRMIHEFQNKEIPIQVFKESDKDFLILNDYLELTNEGYNLTKKGLEFLQRDPNVKIKIQYPLTVKGRVKSYNKVIQSMSDEASNALCCAMVSNGFFNKISNSNMRIVMQHLIDCDNHYKWGEEIITKLNDKLEKSINYFKSKKKYVHRKPENRRQS